MKFHASLALLFLAFGAAAQKGPDTTASRIHFLTSGALGIPDRSLKPVVANGFQAATGIEYVLSKHSVLAGDLSFDGYNYKRASPEYSLEGKLGLTSLSLFYKYNFGNAKWQPYLRVGGGGTRLSLPIISVKSGFSSVKDEAELIGQVQGEVGLQWRVHPRYTLLAGVGRQWVGQSNLLNNKSFGITGFKVGLITPL